MWIITQQLPAGITTHELSRFIDRHLGRRGWLGSLFRHPASLKSCTILKMTDRANGVVERRGLAELSDERPDEEILKRLNGHWLKGARLTVRKYYHRTGRGSYQTRRHSMSSGLRDRRRPDLYIEVVRAKG